MDGETGIKVKVKNIADEQNERIISLAESDTEDSEKLYNRLGFKPWSPKVKPIINEVLPDGAALAAGLKKDDLIISADGKEISDWMQWVDYVKNRPDTTISMVVERQGVHA